MRRTSILKGLYELVGGADTGGIEDFKKLKRLIDDKKEITVESLNLYDVLLDGNYHIKDPESIIYYEYTLQELFKSVEERLNHFLEQDIPIWITIDKLRNDLEDLTDATRISYITLGGDYRDFEDRANVIMERIETLKINSPPI